MAENAIPRQSAIWDDHRNSSAVFDVPPHAADEALEALARLRRDDPALVKWICDGAPRLTEAEHVERFGEPYGGHRRATRPEYAPDAQGTIV